MNTNTATATAMLGWLIVEKLRYGKSTALGAASGAVAGLVAVTPCAGFVSVTGALIIGLLAGAGCAFAISLKNRLGYDDSLDVVGVHLVGGWIGTLSVGFFSTDAINSLANDGIFYGGSGKYGGWNLLLHQFEAAAVVTVFSFVGTFVIAKVIGLVMKTRVTEEDEIAGLDQSIHGETAYDFGTLTGSGAGQYAPAAAASRERVQA
jgi:Amt family ammonium transporter